MFRKNKDFLTNWEIKLIIPKNIHSKNEIVDLIMKKKEILDKLNKIASDDLSNWLESLDDMVEKSDWLDKSAAIATRVLRTLRAKSITKKELAEKMEVSPQYVSKIVKGQENLTLETISKLEKALSIKLVEVKAL